MVAAALLAAFLCYTQGFALPGPQHAASDTLVRRVDFSRNVSSCPGYSLTGLSESTHGLTAKLALKGNACNAFGTDIRDLTIQVTYESQSRLHVNIFDTAQNQFTMPTSIISPPPPPSSKPFKSSSDLVFNYNSSPFAFWITRRSSPSSAPLFDTRAASLPPTPISPIVAGDTRTALDGFPLVFEDQYLQLTSALPLDANIYGLGEAVASAGFRRDVGTRGGKGTIQAMWTRDAGNPVDENEYGVHPFYVEHRPGTGGSPARAHGVFLNSAAGADVMLLTPPGAKTSLVQYRQLGGTFDFYFFSGPSPISVIEQYAEVVGTPVWTPLWAFGFHLCRWGYRSLDEVKSVVKRMRDANIPLEVQWNDIDLYHDLRDFTSNPVTFPGDKMREFIHELHANHQRYIPILDAAVPVPKNSSDVYYPYIKGAELDVFMKNPDGSEYIGQVWPGYTVFPDWFAPATTGWWTESFANWSASGVEFDGIWLDMNEVSSFCDGSCGSSAKLAARGLGAASPAYANAGIDLNTPPYAIHNGESRLSGHGVATNATHHGGYKELDVHNLWGTMEEKATREMLLKLRAGQRPFIISRSTISGAGKFTSHWLGDNASGWASMRYMIQGMLQFQLFQIPMVGADTCGFAGNADEELCNRWMQVGAFTPFYRNHNAISGTSQEPYIWDSVAAASRAAIHERYRLLPYWYSLFANASTRGTPPVRALWFEYTDDPALLGVDTQFLVGTALLVTPVLESKATTVTGHFPGHNAGVVWRDWFTHAPVNVGSDGTATLPAPLGHINVHLRSGSVLLLHKEPGYTTTETTRGPYELLVSLDAQGAANGQAYIDDFISEPPTPSTTVNFAVTKGALTVSGKGSYKVAQRVEKVTILGIGKKPADVKIGGKSAKFEWEAAVGRAVVDGVSLDLNGQATVSWQ